MVTIRNPDEHMCCGEYMAYSARLGHTPSKDDYEFFVCVKCPHKEDILPKTRKMTARLKRHRQKAAV